MKHIALMSTLSVALLASFAAQAADTTELKVTGTIRPAACKPAIAGGGVVDYGNIPAASLTAGAFTKLATKEVPFTLNCDAATKVALKIADNQASTKVTGMTSAFSSTAVESSILGLGAVANKNIGGYQVTLKQGSFTADNANVDTLVSDNNGTSWTKGTLGALYTDRIVSFGPTGATTIGAYKVMSGTLAVTAAIDKPENLPLTQDIPLNGSASIEVLYL